MTKLLYAIANKSTPEGVKVPETAWGFASWVIVQLGGWGVLLGFLAYAYFDHKEESRADKRQVIEVCRDQIEVSTKLTALMEQLQRTTEELAREARTAHRYGGYPTTHETR
jgi:hypothetical protein